MFKCFVKLTGMLCFLSLFLSCSDANNKPLSIAFSADSTKIIFSHIDQAGLQELRNKKNDDSLFNALVTVLQLSSEKDSTFKEQPVAGLLHVRDDQLVFTPEKSFVKGQDYLVITHLNIRFGTASRVLKGQLSYSMKPQQQVLTR